MSEEFLSLGDRVVILENELHPECVGQEGVIEEYGAAFHFWVMMPDGVMYGFNEDELAAAQPPAAETGARGDGSPTIDDVLRAGVAAADRALALEAENNRLREKLAAAQAALNAVFTETQSALTDFWGVHESNMPADKAALFRVFRIADSALQAQQATGGEVAE